MKAVLKFNLEDGDDSMSHKRCVKSLDMSLALWAIKYNMKNYFTLNTSEDAEQTYDDIKSAINTIFDEYNINLDELVV